MCWIKTEFLAIFFLCVSLSYASHSQPIQKGNGRIVSGMPAIAGQFPFAAALYIQTTTSRIFCGGALISDLWILTSGYCITDATIITVQLGSTFLSGTDSNRVIIETDNIIVHPLFDPGTFQNNIGLIMFHGPVTLNDYIRPISFFPTTELPGGTPVVTFGWGETNDGVPGLVNELEYVNVTTLTNEECLVSYGTDLIDSMVCVRGNFNEGLCRGDSGSPLIQDDGAGNTTIVGVGSFISDNGCDTSDPSGFTRVFQYREWISNVTSIPM